MIKYSLQDQGIGQHHCHCVVRHLHFTVVSAVSYLVVPSSLSRYQPTIALTLTDYVESVQDSSCSD